MNKIFIMQSRKKKLELVRQLTQTRKTAFGDGLEIPDQEQNLFVQILTVAG